MAKRVQKTRNNGTMTEAQYFGKISNALRNAFKWWQPMIIALKRAERKNQSSNKRLKFEYQCAHCTVWFPRKEVHIDHIIPCGTLRSVEDIPSLIERLTVEDPDAYQILCKKCHQNKTNNERKERAATSSNEAGDGSVYIDDETLYNLGLKPGIDIAKRLGDESSAFSEAQ